MRYYYFQLIVFFFLLVSNDSKGQWQINSEKAVNWYQISPTGSLIVGTTVGISGMDEKTGKYTYSVNEVYSPKEDEFQIIPNSVFGMLSRGQGKLETKLIFNVTDGKVLYDSKKENMFIGKQYILNTTGDLLMQGLRGMSSVFFLVDASTGKVRWELEDFFGTSIFAEVLDGNPITTEGGHFIIPTTGGRNGGAIYCFSAKDGSQVWKAELPKLKGAQTMTQTTSKLVTSFLQKNMFIYMKGQAIMAYDITTGKEVWTEPAKQKGLPDQVIYDTKGLIVCSAVDPKNNLSKPVMVMYDYQTGNEIWSDQVKLKGTVRKYNYCEKGLIIGMEVGGGKNMLNIVDLQTGSYVFSDHYKVNGTVQEMKLLTNAIYIRTDLEEDIVSLENNTSMLSKNISTKTDKPLVNFRKDDLSYTFNPSDGMLNVTNLKTISQQVLVPDKIEFEQKETPKRIEMIKELIVLSSSQTVAAYSKEGKEVFKTHIPASGISGWKKALYATSAILNSMDAMQYADLETRANQTAKNINSPEGREFCDAIAQLANRGANAHFSAATRDMDMIKKRYKASASGNDVQFILGKLDNKEYALFGISKTTGQKIAEINFGKDKEPKYILDDLSRIIYYLHDEKTMKAIKY